MVSFDTSDSDQLQTTPSSCTSAMGTEEEQRTSDSLESNQVLSLHRRRQGILVLSC